MNYRFLSVLGLSAAMIITGGCSTNKPVAESGAEVVVAEKPAVVAADSTPLWVPEKHPFNPSRNHYHDLLHTTLRVSFDWQKQHLLGLAELILKPYFYPQDTLVLDAKGFDIHGVSLVKENGTAPLKYAYDGKNLKIALDKTYTRNEKYTVEIDYTAKPNELKAGGSEAITADKGLYFINPLGDDPAKPQQIWTQGETEASSAWFPTIDTPNERMTQDVYITVDPKFTTLSNGAFIYSRLNSDGTKTELWKMELPHAPYLAMMAIGEFAVVKDKWRNLDVNYYVEPAYKGTAKKIFGNTPEMLEFFSKKLGVVYPWPSKYSQVVVRDFVSGAMENTTASTFMEDLQLTDRELLDKDWDNIIAHELFHQWFGDYVTTESWANLPLNESFANYSEYLWAEYKYGPDQAAYQQLDELNQYLDEAESKRVPLIRYHYGDKEDMFDSHSYAKGGRILHMLRKYVGDEAFFASLNRYLTKNKLSDVEVAELRMAFEETTREDLMWYFNQWFMQPGHPELKVTDTYQNGLLSLHVMQQQDSAYAPVYRLPLKVAVWVNSKRTEYPIEITKADQTFTIPVSGEPQLVLFDAEHQLLATIDHAKTDQELIFQFNNAKQFLPKFKALAALTQKVNDPAVLKVMQKALKDDYWYIRSTALSALSQVTDKTNAELTEEVKQIAQKDKKGAVRADAILALAEWDSQKYKSIFDAALKDSSYVVASAAIDAYSKTGAPDVDQKLALFEKEQNEDVVLALSAYYSMSAGPEKNDWFVKRIQQGKGSNLYFLLQNFAAYLAKNSSTNTTENITLLANMARNDSQYFIRLAAMQALLSMSDKPEVQTLIKEIKENEKDKRLIEMYKQLPF